jgi:hypothetical protein
VGLILLTVSCGLVSFSPAWLVQHYSVYPLGDATRKTQLSSPWNEILKPGTPHFQASRFALTINTTTPQQKRKVTCTSYVRTQLCRNFFRSHVHHVPLTLGHNCVLTSSVLMYTKRGPTQQGLQRYLYGRFQAAAVV